MTLGRINDVRVPIQVVLGENSLSLEDLASLNQGSIIELQKIAGEPVDLVAAGEKIARGEVVIIDENFGIRITELIKWEK
ncbi:flagellar motor switch protein FliN [Oceanispirochaeta sp.]|jgi:flagellar motor switch protein FliN/FliY|uniref:flagellar motor switch protein FliN n=1 Tax=Oceanispirochaeta sp. TaxID=2035350 RepID=UPI00261C1F07|nr:flagellar motor switch protein FliN [Oceanispirochaeta sp.]MDA3958193.1 flagellar motor switch protein FliN [Oceanispirochaeta sp.]